MIEIDSGYLRGVGLVCPKTPLHIREMTSKEIIQQTKEDIAILQEKLKKLEELENKTPVEEAYKRVYGEYPPTTPSVSNSEDERWSAFQKGYNASKEDCKVVEEPKPGTLYDLIGNWWDNIFVVHNACTNETAIDYLVNDIKKWLPDRIGYEDDDYDRGWNDALRTIGNKLR